MGLVKLGLVQDDTIVQFKLEIERIQNKISLEKQIGQKKYKEKLAIMQNQLKEQSQVLSEEMQKQLILEKNLEESGRK